MSSMHGDVQSQSHSMLISDSMVHNGWAACCKPEFCVVWLVASSKTSVCLAAQ